MTRPCDIDVAARTTREARLEEALRAILAVRLNTTPGVTTERAISKARVEMRQIAEEALRDE